MRLDRVDNRPGCLGLVAADEECLIADHAVVNEALVGLGRLDVERRLVFEFERDRLDVERSAGHLGVQSPTDAFLGLHADDQIIGIDVRIGLLLEQRQGRRAEPHGHFAELPVQAFAGADVKRHPAPAPIVDVQLDGGERLGHRSRRYALGL